MGFPSGTGGKEPTCPCRRYKRREFDPGSRRSPEIGNGNPVQYFSMENPCQHFTPSYPGDSPKNLSGLSTKNDLLILGHWLFFNLINYANCITSHISHFKLVAGQPEVKSTPRS